MMRGGHGPIRQLQDLNWGAFDHASHAPQLRSCNYNMYNVMYNNIQHVMYRVIISESVGLVDQIERGLW